MIRRRLVAASAAVVPPRTEMISGSLPVLSLTAPGAVVFAVPGKVTGTLTEQVLPVVRVTLVMDFPSAE